MYTLVGMLKSLITCSVLNAILLNDASDSILYLIAASADCRISFKAFLRWQAGDCPLSWVSRHQAVEHLAKATWSACAADVLSRGRSRESSHCVNCWGQWTVTEQRCWKRWGCKHLFGTVASIRVGLAMTLATVVALLWREADDRCRPFSKNFLLIKL